MSPVLSFQEQLLPASVCLALRRAVLWFNQRVGGRVLREVWAVGEGRLASVSRHHNDNNGPTGRTAAVGLANYGLILTSLIPTPVPQKGLTGIIYQSLNG